jgi:hypothetical protein
MRRLSGVIGALILTIAAYFVLFWGYDALRILTSPTYGLEDVWRSQVVFALGRYIGLGPQGLIQLAAALGAVKLVVASVCLVHVIERMRALFTGRPPATEMLEPALIIAVAISVAAAVPAIWSHNADLLRQQFVQLVLAALTGALCILERGAQRKTQPQLEIEPAAAVETAPAEPFVPWHR